MSAAFDLSKLHIQGWTPPRPDHRALKLAPPPVEKAAATPDLIDMRAACPAIYNQLNLGACTAHAVGFIWHMAMKEVEGTTPEAIAMMKLYFDCRAAQGTVNSDSGSSNHMAMKMVAKFGLAHMHLWPYVTANFKKKPTQAAYADGMQHVPTNMMYGQVPQTRDAIMTMLAAAHPIAWGFSVPASFMTQQMAKTGQMVMPSKSEKVVGGHAVALVGYDKKRDVAFGRNSWGTSWGMQGYFEVPFDFLCDSNWCDDFWATLSGPLGY